MKRSANVFVSDNDLPLSPTAVSAPYSNDLASKLACFNNSNCVCASNSLNLVLNVSLNSAFNSTALPLLNSNNDSAVNPSFNPPTFSPLTLNTFSAIAGDLTIISLNVLATPLYVPST